MGRAFPDLIQDVDNHSRFRGALLADSFPNLTMSLLEVDREYLERPAQFYFWTGEGYLFQFASCQNVFELPFSIHRWDPLLCFLRSARRPNHASQHPPSREHLSLERQVVGLTHPLPS